MIFYLLMLVFHYCYLFVVFVFLLFFIWFECLFVCLLNYRFCLYFDRIAEISFSTLETNFYRLYFYLNFTTLPAWIALFKNHVFTLYWFSMLEPLRKVRKNPLKIYICTPRTFYSTMKISVTTKLATTHYQGLKFGSQEKHDFFKPSLPTDLS
jgi:hypothetical protein